jgi:Ca2+-binding RTX toxin-like protein
VVTYEQRGGEVLANTSTSGNQDAAEIAYLADGRFVLVWRDASHSAGDTSGTAIRGQIFNADGSKAGSEFLANTVTAGDQITPTLTALAGGGFVVGWRSNFDVFAQVFDSAGAKSGGEVLLNGPIVATESWPVLAALADGGFVATWMQSTAADSGEIKAQRFDSAGAKVGSEIAVNSSTPGIQSTPSVAVLADGHFVVIWQFGKIMAQLFEADGTPIGTEFIASTAPFGDQINPSVAALAGGGFVVAWEDGSESAVTGGPGIRAQMYDGAGAAVGGPIAVNVETYGSQYAPFVAGLTGGGFVVEWVDTSRLGTDTSVNSAKARIYDSAGAPLTGEFVVNSVTAGSQYATGIAASPDGFTAAWADLSGIGGDASGSGIKFQRFVASSATEGADTLSGTEGFDVIHGFGGDDQISGLGGDDRLEGGDGADTVYGGDGNDSLDGGAGDDTLDGGAGRDSMAGGAGMDHLIGGADDDSLDGGDDSDFVEGGDGADSLAGGAGDDQLQGGLGADRLDGGTGNDSLDGGDGDDVLTHVAAAGSGWELVAGGAGSDSLTADYRAVAAAVTMAAPTADGLGGWSGSIATADGHQLGFSGIELLSVTGGSAGDTLVGAGGNESLYGMGGNDRLEGGDGNDLLDGGTGSDTMIGGMGDDSYYVDAAGDVITEAADAGTDTVWTTRSMTLGTNFENLRGLGTAGLTLTGNGGANLITGTTGNDWIDGGPGADRMEGGNGNDTYVVDDIGDVVYDLFTYDPLSPVIDLIDTVRVSIASFSLVGTGADNIVGLLTTGQSFTGSSGDNVLTGNSGDDRLDGGAGRDTMSGGAGNDTYVVDDALDKVNEAANAGTDEVLVSLSNYTLPANVENGTLTKLAFNTLNGNELDNVLKGTSESETFDGKAGADTMIGGLGSDTYYVDNAGDVVVEAAGVNDVFGDKVYTGLAYYQIPVGVEILEGTAAKQTLVGSDSGEWIISAGGGDTMIGGKGNDLYYASAGDTIVELEGEGIDTIRTTLASYTLPDNVEELQAVSFSIAQTLIGNALDNRIIGTLLNNQGDVIDGGLGADTMIGYHGNDIYYVDNSGDVVVENVGQGTDEVRTGLAVYVLPTNVENLTAINDLGHDFRGNSANNVITGGAGNDTIRVYDGGNDTVHSGGGDDLIFIGAALTAADVIDGGANNDTLIIQGNYVGGLTLTANVTNIENLSILNGANTNIGAPGTQLYDYVITTNDANFAAGLQVRVNAGALLPGEDLTFSGAAETDASFVIYGGRGKDTLTGGLGNDIFFFAEQLQFAPGDTVNGGSGYDSVYFRGNYTIDFNAPGYAGQFNSIESITLTSASDTRYARGGPSEFDYDVKLADANLASGVTLTVNGTLLQSFETMNLDGSQETDGFLRIFAGFSDDTIKGGGQADLIHGNFGADTLTGGGGADTFRYQKSGESTATSMDHILDFTPGTDKIELTRMDADTNVDGNQAFHWIDSNAFTAGGASSAGELRAYEQNGTWFVEGDTNGDGSGDFLIALTLQGQTPLGQNDFFL